MKLMISMNKQVDQHSSTTPKKRLITVPSLASIEEMRTAMAFENLEEGNIVDHRSKLGHNESKNMPIVAASPNRTPFADVN